MFRPALPLPLLKPRTYGGIEMCALLLLLYYNFTGV